MTEQLTGRALDEECARAMGWNHPTPPSSVWIRDTAWCFSPPVYSTDPATLGEMLAWLEARAYTINLMWNDRHKAWMVVMEWNEGTLKRPGANLNEATARLVVAVKEAQP